MYYLQGSNKSTPESLLMGDHMYMAPQFKHLLWNPFHSHPASTGLKAGTSPQPTGDGQDHHSKAPKESYNTDFLLQILIKAAAEPGRTGMGPVRTTERDSP